MRARADEIGFQRLIGRPGILGTHIELNDLHVWMPTQQDLREWDAPERDWTEARNAGLIHSHARANPSNIYNECKFCKLDHNSNTPEQISDSQKCVITYTNF